MNFQIKRIFLGTVWIVWGLAGLGYLRRWWQTNLALHEGRQEGWLRRFFSQLNLITGTTLILWVLLGILWLGRFN